MVTLVIGSMTFWGCSAVPQCAGGLGSQYLMAEYRIGAESARTAPAEVSETPAYLAQRTGIRKVAIRFPDTCHDAGAANVSGKSAEGSGGTTIFKSRCGVWLGELERAFSANGFIVYSSDAVHQQEKLGKSAYVAAADLGADVVIMFNSLEAPDVRAGGLAGTRFLYFKSNEKGEELGPQALDDATRTYLRTFIKQRKEPKGAEPVVALASILDATAILAKPLGNAQPGESIWFYRRTVTRPLKSTGSMKFLFSRTDDKAQWTITMPDLPPSALPPPPPPVSEEVSVTSTSDISDPYATERLVVVRASATDFVNRFSGKVTK